MLPRDVRLLDTRPLFLLSMARVWATTSAVSRHYDSSFPGAGDVWVTLRNITYQNNSIVILENIGENDDALLCMTNQTETNSSITLGNWYFPNGTTVPSFFGSIYSDRGQMVVRMHRREGGEEGMYRCEILDSLNVTQTIYIGVYSASTGECTHALPVLFN